MNPKFLAARANTLARDNERLRQENERLARENRLLREATPALRDIVELARRLAYRHDYWRGKVIPSEILDIREKLRCL